jgi:hypothetical protein
MGCNPTGSWRDFVARRTKFNRQYDEPKQDCREQNHHEIAEGFLLLLIKTAIYDCVRRQTFVLA